MRPALDTQKLSALGTHTGNDGKLPPSLPVAHNAAGFAVRYPYNPRSDKIIRKQERACVFMEEHVIAIDGPAGSGKSTAARRLADAIGYTHLNTGAMYRAVAFKALENGIDLNDEEHVSDIADAMKFEYRIVAGKQHFIINGNDCTHELFTAALTQQLKPVVNNPAVRGVLVKKMRDAVHHFLQQGMKGVVMEGRDIGTVVFPDAPLKFYIHADLDTRARRRAAELKSRNEIVDLDGLKKQIQYRDETDQQREIGALKQAHDAIDIDSSALDEQAVLGRLLEEVKKRKLN